MTKGPRRLVLDQYLDSSAPGAVMGAGRDWKDKADDLQELGDALKQAAAQAELRIGEQTLTGPALRAGMEKSSASILVKSDQLRAAGQALQHVGQLISDARDVRDSLADLGQKPPPYQAPGGTPGVEPTPEEIQAQADASQARANERSAWQTQYEQQEATSLALTKQMDAAFLAAIPPMKEIHGQQDPTEPPPGVPSGPGGRYLAGTQAPPPTGGGGDGGGDGGGHGGDGGGSGGGGDGDGDPGTDGGEPKPPTSTTVVTNRPTLVAPAAAHPPLVDAEGPTSTLSGTSHNGVAYQPTGSQVSAPSVGGSVGGGVGGSSSGASVAALGAAGGAGALAAGVTRAGSLNGGAASSSAPVRAIGSTGRAGSAGALSRPVGSAGSGASPASRSAGTAAGRGASTGSSGGRGSAGGRAGAGAGSGSGSRSGGRGTSGARGAGAGVGGRSGERERTTDRDSLVYDQDWLGDDEVAPGVLD